MKRVLKSSEPPLLTMYRALKPDGDWEEMRKDGEHGGEKVYSSCRETVVSDQGGLCAYCEIVIRDAVPLGCRVEHFHPKADKMSSMNWAYCWDTMLGVCNGGDNPYIRKDGFHLAPIGANLSCDAHKNTMIQSGKLSEQCEGLILNPLELPSFPALCTIAKSTGFLHPDRVSCGNVELPLKGKHATVEELVQNTIDMLNLNCDRLAQMRLRIIRDIEHNKKNQRNMGYTAHQGLANLARWYFKRHWPGFFTTIRLCLGSAAERHLRDIDFKG